MYEEEYDYAESIRDPRPTKERLVKAGFDPKEFEYYSFKYDDKPDWYGESGANITDVGLKFVAETAKSEASRKKFVGMLSYYADDEEGNERMAGALNRVAAENKDNDEFKRQFSVFLELISKDNVDSFFEFNERVRYGLEAMSDERIYSLFGRDPGKIAGFLTERYEWGKHNAAHDTAVLNILKSSMNAQYLLNGLEDERLMTTLNLNNIQSVLVNKESATLINSFYSGKNRTWTDRMLYFKEVFKLNGMSLPRGVESDKAVFEHVEFAEDPANPVNSLGISTTVGPEIEYQSDTKRVEALKKTYILDQLEILGFQRGVGATGLDEASPGPFLSPDTVAAIYELYSEAGIINSGEYLGMNYHFNVGTIEQTDAARVRLIALVRSLYMTGAGYDPHAGWPQREDLHIQINDDHWESKVFDITTDEDFKWNFRSATYLTWAMKADLEKGKRRPGDTYREELAGLWNEYVNTMDSAMKQLGFDGYVYALQNHDLYGRKTKSVEFVHNQLAKIWKDPMYYELPNLDRVGQKEEDNPNPDGIRGVKVGGVWYPNIAAFSRELTNRVVNGIIDVAEKIETDCRDDIEEIDMLEGSSRNKAIKKFINKYSVKVDEPESKKSQEEAFEKVRKNIKSDRNFGGTRQRPDAEEKPVWNY